MGAWWILTTILQPKGGCDQSMNVTCARASLTTILQPKGGCDSVRTVWPESCCSHNHPSAERRLRHDCSFISWYKKAHNHPSAERRLRRKRCRRRKCRAAHNHPSAERRLRLADGGDDGPPVLLTTILQPKGGCDISEVVANSSILLTTILQPKGGCDLTKSRGTVSPLSHNHPSAERRLRLVGLDPAALEIAHNHPSAERRLRRPRQQGTRRADGSQPSFSRKAVAT